MRITRGLIIADPWIGYILDGAKDWEMRSLATSHRGWFALIRKGTGAIYGVARLIETGRPLSPAEMIATFAHHRIPEYMIYSGEVAKWNTPWKLVDVRRFERPVAYQHKSGAVTWVKLNDAAVDGIASQFGAGRTVTLPEAVVPLAGASRESACDSASMIEANSSERGRELQFDIDRDDSKPRVTTSAKVTPSIAAAQTVRSVTSAMTASLTAIGRVVGEVEITDGNISNNHIYLRSFFDRFPADAIGGSNKTTRAKRDLTIEWGGAEPVQTDLDGQKKFFRARGWIGSFFQLHRARAGDRVVVEEIGAYQYRVSLKRHESRAGLMPGLPQ